MDQVFPSREKQSGIASVPYIPVGIPEDLPKDIVHDFVGPSAFRVVGENAVVRSYEYPPIIVV